MLRVFRHQKQKAIPKEIEEMAQWLNELCKGKPKKFVLQGFKNNGKFIDENFKKNKDTKEEYLKDLREILYDYFEEIEIRV